MKKFMCPQGNMCGPVNLHAKKRAQTYFINTAVLDRSQNFCNHEISFSIDGGISDIIYLRFTESAPKTKVEFAVG